MYNDIITKCNPKITQRQKGHASEWNGCTYSI